MKAIGITALVLTVLLFRALRPETQAALPPWAPLVVLAVIGGILLRLRHALRHASSGSLAGSGGNDVSLGCHEYAHGLAVAKGGGKVKRMVAGEDGGYTDYDLGTMREESPEHLRAIAAGREAQIAYLTRNGHSRREAELAADSHGDDVELHKYASSRDVSRARRAAQQFVRQRYNRIERGGRRLARKGTMTDL